MQATMSGTTAPSVSSPDGAAPHDLRERVTLIAFVVVAIVATTAWFILLAWALVAGLRAVGV